MEIQFDLLENLIEALLPEGKNRELEGGEHRRGETAASAPDLSTEMRFLSFDQLEYATRSLNQIGSMIGGKLLKTGRAA